MANSIKTIDAMMRRVLGMVPKEPRDQEQFGQIVDGMVRAHKGAADVALPTKLFPAGLPDEYALVSLHAGLSDSLATLCSRVRYDAGKVVATAEIKQGSAITMHPWDAVIVGNVWMLDFTCQGPTMDARHQYRVAERSTEITHLVGDPLQTSKPQWLGHVIRDGAGNPYAAIVNADDHAAISEATINYVRQASDACNATFVQLSTKTIIAVATRDIDKDEEITIDRDPPYWYTVQYGVHESGLTAMLARTLSEQEKQELTRTTIQPIADLNLYI